MDSGKFCGIPGSRDLALPVFWWLSVSFGVSMFTSSFGDCMHRQDRGDFGQTTNMLKTCTFHVLRRITQSECVAEPSKCSSPLVQFVRWRKRRWAPINRSKMYYVRKPTPRNHEEWTELKQRTDSYHTTLRALV